MHHLQNIWKKYTRIIIKNLSKAFKYIIAILAAYSFYYRNHTYTVAFDGMNDDEKRSEQARLATRAGQEGPLKPGLPPIPPHVPRVFPICLPPVHSSISLFSGRSKYALSNLVRLHGPAMTHGLCYPVGSSPSRDLLSFFSLFLLLFLYRPPPSMRTYTSVRT